MRDKPSQIYCSSAATSFISIFKMKKLFISNLILGTAIFNSWAVSVQASSTCFMLDSNGNTIDLGNLCQGSNSTRTTRPRRSIPVPTQAVAQKGVHVVPIKSRRSGIPVIDVKFNDRYIFEMMLDTGASSVVITQQMARKLRVNHLETVLVSTPSSSSFKMPAGYVSSVGIGKLTKKNIRVITSPSMNMGLLGQSFFGSYDITIKSDVVEFRER